MSVPDRAAMTDPAWMHAGSVEEIAPAFVAALGELHDVSRDQTAAMGTYSYRYATLSQVLSEARRVLGEHGLGLFQVAYIDDRDVVVETTVMHTSGQWLRFAPLRLPAGQTAQQSGSAITYARRYSALCILGMATEDDDGSSAGTRPTALSDGQVHEFLTACRDAGLTKVQAGDVVAAATKGRTRDPYEALTTEVAALNGELAAAVENPASPLEAPASILDAEDEQDEFGEEP